MLSGRECGLFERESVAPARCTCHYIHCSTDFGFADAIADAKVPDREDWGTETRMLTPDLSGGNEEGRVLVVTQTSVDPAFIVPVPPTRLIGREREVADSPTEA